MKYYSDTLPFFSIEEMPVFLLNVLLIYLLVRPKYKKYKHTPVGYYFRVGIFLKLLAGLLHFAIYKYYFLYGDTLNYYSGILDLRKALAYNPNSFLSLLFEDRAHNDPVTAGFLRSTIHIGLEERITMRFGLFFSYPAFNYFISLGLWYSLFAFFGLWRLFKILIDIFPKYIPLAGITCFIIPSILIWSCSISKDALTVGGLGILASTFYWIFIKGKYKFWDLILFLGMIMFVGGIKGFIVVIFLASSIFWIVLNKTEKIRNFKLRVLARPFFFVFFLALGFGGTILFQRNSLIEQAAVEDAMSEMEVYNQYQSSEKVARSRYSIGEFNASIAGILRIMPAAINVTLFRPYPTDITSVGVLFASLESTLALAFFIFLLYKVGILFFLRLSLVIIF